MSYGIIKNNNEKTFYTKHGNVFSLVLLGFIINSFIFINS